MVSKDNRDTDNSLHFSMAGLHQEKASGLNVSQKTAITQVQDSIHAVKDHNIRVEMILQALEYETEHGKVLDEFFLSTAGKFQTEIGRSWAAEVISRRKRLGNGFT